MTLRTHRIDGFDHLVERHVGMREGHKVGDADLLEELRERRRGIDAGAEDEGVDEHADEVVEGTITATGDRRAHRHVLGVAETREQHGEGGVQDHEAGRAVGVGEAVDAGEDVGGDPEAGVGTPVGRRRGSRPVGGQFEHGRGVGEDRGPVVELLRDRCLRIVRVAEHSALPQCEVGVLHRQGFPGGLCVVEARGVGDEDVACQRHGRRTVGADVVDDHHEHVGAVVLPEQRAADGDLAGDVEAASHHSGDRGVQASVSGVSIGVRSSGTSPMASTCCDGPSSCSGKTVRSASCRSSTSRTAAVRASMSRSPCRRTASGML